MIELISETYLGLCQTSTMEFFIETSWQLLVDIYFRKESSVTNFPAGFLYVFESDLFHCYFQ